jgi:hypothetical protein
MAAIKAVIEFEKVTERFQLQVELRKRRARRGAREGGRWRRSKGEAAILEL